MQRSFHFVRLAIVAACLPLVLGASLPQAMAGPGEWEIGRTPSGPGERVCLPDAAMLMQWEHRGKQCERTVVTSTLDRAEVHYSCARGGFGTSRVEMLTSRSVRIQTQGIADGLPFQYVIHARRVGSCAAH